MTQQSNNNNNKEVALPVAVVYVELAEEELKTINSAMKAFSNTDIVRYVKNAVMRFAQDELALATMLDEIDLDEDKCVRYDP